MFKSFLGIPNYFRHLIPKYADKAHPLVELTKKRNSFSWSSEVDSAFMNLQKELIEKLSIYTADITKPFILITDASAIAISGILTQLNEENKEIPIEYYSRKMNETQIRYASWKSELFAVYKLVEHFREYLFGTKFTLKTDAKTEKMDLSTQPPGVIRWLLYLQCFDMEITHIPGKHNPADLLSGEIFTLYVKPVYSTQGMPEEVKNLLNNTVQLNIENVRIEQLYNTYVQEIISQLKQGVKRRALRKFKYDEEN